jgi:hypothetical protein
MMEHTITIPFQPITVNIDGNDFILANEHIASKFLELVEDCKNSGIPLNGHLKLVLGDDFEMRDTDIYSDAQDAFMAYRLI